MAENSPSPVIRLRRFFECKSVRGEISFPEFTAWYKSLEESERAEFKTLVSSWDGNSEFIPLDVVPAADNQSAVTVVAA